MTHSKLPWLYSERDGCHAIYDADGFLIADEHTHLPPTAPRVDDAKFIVAACNAYSAYVDLLAACDLIMRSVIYPPGSRPDWFQAVSSAAAKAHRRSA